MHASQQCSSPNRWTTTRSLLITSANSLGDTAANVRKQLPRIPSETPVDVRKTPPFLEKNSELEEHFVCDLRREGVWKYLNVFLE